MPHSVPYIHFDNHLHMKLTLTHKLNPDKFLRTRWGVTLRPRPTFGYSYYFRFHRYSYQGPLRARPGPGAAKRYGPPSKFHFDIITTCNRVKQLPFLTGPGAVAGAVAAAIPPLGGDTVNINSVYQHLMLMEHNCACFFHNVIVYGCWYHAPKPPSMNVNPQRRHFSFVQKLKKEWLGWQVSRTDIHWYEGPAQVHQTKQREFQLDSYRQFLYRSRQVYCSESTTNRRTRSCRCKLAWASMNALLGGRFFKGKARGS